MKENKDSNTIFNSEFSFDFGNDTTTNEYFTYKKNKKTVLNECKQNKSSEENIEDENTDDEDFNLDKHAPNLSKNDEDDIQMDDVEDDEETLKSKQDLEEIKKRHGMLF